MRILEVQLLLGKIFNKRTTQFSLVTSIATVIMVITYDCLWQTDVVLALEIVC